MSLPNGHYRVNADQASPRPPGEQKHKMFWVECPSPAGGGQAGGEQAGGGGQAGGEQAAGGGQAGGEQAAGGGQAGGEQAAGGGQAGGGAVAGVQQPPQQAAVTPIVEQPAAPAAAAQAQVAGRQMMPVQQLPSTSTVPMAPTLVSGMLMGITAWMLRRRGEDR
jgi:hypothetical protein